MSRRSPQDAGIRISRRVVTIATKVVGAVLLLVALVGATALARANEPVAVATAAQLKVQQAAAERDVERAYEQASDQVRKVRALNLAITTAQADQIAARAQSDLKTLRHSAFASLGANQGFSPAEAESYAVAVEGRFDQAPASKQPSPTPVLLAPRHYTIVSRMSELATLISDQATTALTAPAAPASPSPSPTPTPRPSSTPSPSPSR